VFNFLMKNPIIKRYSFSLFRKSSIIIAGIIYVSLLILINSFALLYLITKIKSGTTTLDIKELATLVYPWMLALSVLVFWVMASITPVSILFSQIVKGSQDFFEILPLSGFKKASGLLIGTNLIYYPLSIISMVITVQYGILAGLRVGLQLNIIYLFTTVGIFCNTLSVLTGVSSIKLKKRQKSVGGNPLVAVVFGVIFLGFPLLGVLSHSSHAFFDLDQIKISFYNFKIPIMLLIGTIALYFAVWNFIGSARKLTDKTLPFFTRPGAVIYFLSLQVLLFGFLFEYTLDNKLNRENIYGLFGIITFFLMLIISIASLRHKKKIFHAIERITISQFNPIHKKSNNCETNSKDKDSTSMKLLKITNESNLPIFIILFTLWSIPTLTTLILSKTSSLNIILIHFLTFLVFTLFVAGISELYILLKDNRWKYHFIVTLFVFIYQGGICLGGILTQSSSLLIFSFPGYLFSILETSLFCKVSMTERIQALGFNLFTSIALLSGVFYLYYLYLEKIKILNQTQCYQKWKKENK